MRGEGAWTLFKLIGFIGFIKLIRVNTMEAGRLGCREAIRDRSFEGESMYEELQTKGEGRGMRDERFED